MRAVQFDSPRALLFVATIAACSLSFAQSPATGSEPVKMPPGRCVIDKAADESDAKLGVHAICMPLDAEIDKDWLEVPTELITRAFSLYVFYSKELPKGIQVWDPVTNRAVFKVPDRPKNSDGSMAPPYAICRLTAKAHSLIGGPGKYMHNGWLRPANSNVAYFQINMVRRPTGQGKTSFHSDIVFAYVGEEQLQAARQAGRCMTPQQLAQIPVPGAPGSAG